ncbi:MAG: AAA family ATPase [Planctomycetes bacterium]|nr:AAA family ATPase [Planctomycetota bacterium]
MTPLAPAALRRRCDPDALPFDATDALEPASDLPGQARAFEALRFGVGIRAHDYNIFAVGPTGLGKHAVVRDLLEARAAADPVPDDWCYVHGFATRHAPVALALPAGRGAALRDAMERLLPELRAQLRERLGSDEVGARTKAIAEELARRHSEAMEQVEQEAAARGIGVEETADGFSLTPLRDGEPVPREAFERLPDEEKERVRTDMRAVRERMIELLGQAHEWGHAARSRGRRLLVEVAAEVVTRALSELRRGFATRRWRASTTPAGPSASRGSRAWSCRARTWSTSCCARTS